MNKQDFDQLQSYPKEFQILVDACLQEGFFVYKVHKSDIFDITPFDLKDDKYVYLKHACDRIGFDRISIFIPELHNGWINLGRIKDFKRVVEGALVLLKWQKYSIEYQTDFYKS